ncbi:MAG: ABC transporter permease [Aerococcaceae bacterium]|nr:ABC transporter permease [Aerococcaceae bacterium]
MKLWQCIKTSVVLSFKQFPLLALSVVVMPVVMALIMGLVSERLFASQVVMPEVSVYVDNQEEGALRSTFTEVFEHLESTQVLTLKDSADSADFMITIPRNFGENLQQGIDNPIRIEEKASHSAKRLALLEVLMKQVTQPMVEATAYGKLTNNAQLGSEIVQQITLELSRVQYQEEVYQGTNFVSGMQFQSIAGMSFALLTVLTSVMIAAVKPELAGVNKRTALVPLMPKERVLFSVISTTIVYSALLVTYMLIWKLIEPSTFEGNPLIYLGLVTLNVAVISSVGHLLSLFVNEKSANSMSGIVTMVVLLLSGFVPFDKMSDNPIFQVIGRNPIRAWLVEPFLTNLSGASVWQQHYMSLIVSAIVMMLSVWINIQVLRRREEYHQ